MKFQPKYKTIQFIGHISKYVYYCIFESMLSIPYRTGRYGRNIPYRPAIRYGWPLCFVLVEIPAVPASYRPYRQIPAVPAGIWIPDRNIKRPCFVNFDIFKGKIVILLNPNSKTLALPNSRTTLFLSFFLSFSLTLSLSYSVLSLSRPICLSLSRQLRCSVSHSLPLLCLSLRHSPPLLCLSLSAALSLTLSATLR